MRIKISSQDSQNINIVDVTMYECDRSVCKTTAGHTNEQCRSLTWLTLYSLPASWHCLPFPPTFPGSRASQLYLPIYLFHEFKENEIVT